MPTLMAVFLLSQVALAAPGGGTCSGRTGAGACRSAGAGRTGVATRAGGYYYRYGYRGYRGYGNGKPLIAPGGSLPGYDSKPFEKVRSTVLPLYLQSKTGQAPPGY